jgi:hypothetical protein
VSSAVARVAKTAALTVALKAAETADWTAYLWADEMVYSLVFPLASTWAVLKALRKVALTGASWAAQMAALTV